IGIDVDAEIKPKELELAITLADQVTSERFDPSSYEDEELARLKDVIDRKIEGEEVSLVADEEPQAQVIDLMEALRRSLEDTPSGKRSGKAASSKRKPAKRAPRKSSSKSKKKKKG
ncbi:MAG: Ku protein, partial [Thermoanaerobaculia bacterium]|nr:Ku protein [Thermoanaerobaculia bacterium]